MDTSSVVLTPVLGQTSVTVSFYTNALIAACQSAAWKISGWLDNITIHHAKGCACCQEYINYLLGAQSLGQINLLHPDVENAVQSAWPIFINSIKIDADEHMQGQIIDLHVQIDELKDALVMQRSPIAVLRQRSPRSTAASRSLSKSSRT